jgi:hypothetical protein
MSANQINNALISDTIKETENEESTDIAELTKVESNDTDLEMIKNETV